MTDVKNIYGSSNIIGDLSVMDSGETAIITLKNSGIIDFTTDIHFKSSGATAMSIGTNGNVIVDGALQVKSDIHDYTLYAQNSNGRVGINMLNPQTQFHIHEPSTANVFLKITNDNTSASVTDGLDIGFETGVSYLIKGHDFADMRFETGSSGNMVLQNLGNFGINTTAPNAKFHLVSGTTSGVALRVDGLTTNILTVKDSGNVGVGTSNPSERLHTVGGNVLLDVSAGTFKVSTSGGVALHATSNYATVGSITRLSGSTFTVNGTAVVSSTFYANGTIIVGGNGNMSFSKTAGSEMLYKGQSGHIMQMQGVNMLVIDHNNNGGHNISFGDDILYIKKSGGIDTNRGVSFGDTTLDEFALASFNSTTQGILLPRMTEVQRDGITASPTTGLILYNTDSNKFDYYNGATWSSINSGGGGSDGNGIYDGSGNVPSATVATLTDYIEFSGTTSSRIDLTNGSNSRAYMGIGADYGQLVLADTTNTNTVILRATGLSEFKGIGIHNRQIYRLDNSAGVERGQMAVSGSDYGQIVLKNTSNAQTVIIRGTGEVGFDTGGDFGIGTLNPSEKLHVVGNARISDLSGAGSVMVIADNNGVLGTQSITGGIIQNTSWVSKSGNDSTGKLGEMLFPFLTIQAALDAVGTTDVIVYSGTYTEDLTFTQNDKVLLSNATIVGDITMQTGCHLSSVNRTGNIVGRISHSGAGNKTFYVHDLNSIKYTGTGVENMFYRVVGQTIDLWNINEIEGTNVSVMITGETNVSKNINLIKKVGGGEILIYNGTVGRYDDISVQNLVTDGNIFQGFTGTDFTDTLITNCQFEYDENFSRDGSNISNATFINCTFRSVSAAPFAIRTNSGVTASFIDCKFEGANTYIFEAKISGNKSINFLNCISNKPLYDTGNADFDIIENGNYSFAAFKVNQNFSIN